MGSHFIGRKSFQTVEISCQWHAGGAHFYTCGTYTMCIFCGLAWAWNIILSIMGSFNQKMGCWDRQRFNEHGKKNQQLLFFLNIYLLLSFQLHLQLCTYFICHRLLFVFYPTLSVWAWTNSLCLGIWIQSGCRIIQMPGLTDKSLPIFWNMYCWALYYFAYIPL